MQSPYREAVNENIPYVETDVADITINHKCGVYECKIIAKIFAGYKFVRMPHLGERIQPPRKADINKSVEEYISSLKEKVFIKAKNPEGDNTDHYVNILKCDEIMVKFSKTRVQPIIEFHGDEDTKLIGYIYE